MAGQIDDFLFLNKDHGIGEYRMRIAGSFETRETFT
jgi:hypothetical protein